MYRKTYYATNPESIHGSTNEELRQRYLIGELFAADELRLNYTHYERLVVGGAAPVNKSISLPLQQEPASAKDKPFLERRDQAVLDDLLGEIEVAEDSHQGARESPGLLPEDRGHGCVCDGACLVQSPLSFPLLARSRRGLRAISWRSPPPRRGPSLRGSRSRR